MILGRDYWTGLGPGMGNENSIIIVMFWVLIIAGMVIFFRRFHRGTKAKFSDRLATSVDILQRRCSGSEISKDEFDRRRSNLIK